MVRQTRTCREDVTDKPDTCEPHPPTKCKTLFYHKTRMGKLILIIKCLNTVF